MNPRPVLFALLLSLLATSPAGAQEEAPKEKQKRKDPRRVIPAKTVPSSDTISFTSPSTDYVLEDAIVQASPRTGIIFYDHKGPHTGTRLRNVLIHVAPKTIPLGRSYWAFRGYDMVDTVFDRVEIRAMGRVTEKHDEGHAIYVNVAGDFTVVDSFIHHNGGQGLQLVNRPRETDFPKGPMPGTVTIERTRFHENGFNPDRGGFQVSIFGTGQDIVLRDLEIVAGLDERVKWNKDRTGGALVIEPEPYAPQRNKLPWWRPEEPPEDFEPPFTNGTVLLENVTIRFRNPSKSLAQIKGCRELIVRNCTFEAEGETEGKVVLDHPDKPGRASGRIVWEGNQGNAVVILGGQRRGLVGQDFVIEGEDSPSTDGSR